MVFASVVAAAAAGRTGRVPAVVMAIGGRSPQSLVAVDVGRNRIERRYRVGGVRAYALSPRGRSLAYTTRGSAVGNQLRVLDLLTGRSRLLARARRGRAPAAFGEIAWSPNRRTIAVTRGAELTGARLELVDPHTGKVRRSFAVGARSDSRLAWTSGGSAVVFAAGSLRAPKLKRLNVATGRTSRLGVGGLDPAVAPGGAIAFTAPGGIRILRGRASTTLVGTRRGDRSPASIRGGRALLFERPIGGCPRGDVGIVCSRVLVAALTGRSPPRLLLDVPARRPATR